MCGTPQVQSTPLLVQAPVSGDGAQRKVSPMAYGPSTKGMAWCGQEGAMQTAGKAGEVIKRSHMEG